MEINDIEVLGIAHNGQIGADLINRVKPDFVLLDLWMDNYDGFYCMDHIDMNSTKVIVLTGDVKKETKERLVDKNILFFNKGIEDFDNIVDMIKDA